LPISGVGAPGVGSGPELPPMVVHEPFADNPGQAYPVFESTQTDEPEVEPTIVLEPPSFVEPTGEELAAADVSGQPEQASDPAPVVADGLASAPVTAPVTVLRQRTAALWALAVGV